MAREKLIPEHTVVEGIVSYEWHLGEKVKILVGIGSMVSGKFIPDPEQTYTEYTIDEEDYDSLVSTSPSWRPGKSGGSFELSDLYVAIDHVDRKEKLPEGDIFSGEGSRKDKKDRPRT